MTIGKLVVALIANTDPFSKGMMKASRRLDSFGKMTQGWGMRTMMAGAAILAPIAAATKRFADYGDQVAKMARRTALSVKTVSELAYMAEISGTNIEGLGKGMKRLAVTITDANDGLAESVRAFANVGLRAEDLARMTPERAFLAIAEAIAKTEDPYLRSSSAQKIFGRAGEALLVLFDLGAEGMAKLAKRAEQLGVVLDKKTALEAEQLTDALTDLKKGMTGVSIAIVRGLGIPFDTLSDQIARTTERVRFWIRSNEEVIRNIARIGLALTALGASLLALGITARAVAFIMTPAGAFGMAALGILTLLDALGVVNLGWSDFLGNIRIGSTKISTWIGLAVLNIQKEWAFVKAMWNIGWPGMKATALAALTEIGEAGMKMSKAILWGIQALIRALRPLAAQVNKRLAPLLSGMDLLIETQINLLDKRMEDFSKAQGKRWKALFTEFPELIITLLRKLRIFDQAAGALILDDLAAATQKADELREKLEPDLDPDDLLGGIGKGIQRPAALEKGTVAYYSAAIAQPHYRGLEAGVQDMVEEEKKTNEKLDVLPMEIGAELRAFFAITSIL